MLGGLGRWRRESGFERRGGCLCGDLRGRRGDPRGSRCRLVWKGLSLPVQSFRRESGVGGRGLWYCEGGYGGWLLDTVFLGKMVLNPISEESERFVKCTLDSVKGALWIRRVLRELYDYWMSSVL